MVDILALFWCHMLKDGVDPLHDNTVKFLHDEDQERAGDTFVNEEGTTTAVECP